MTDTRVAEIRIGQATNLAASFEALQGHASIDEWLDAVRQDVPKIKAFIDEMQAVHGVQAAFPGAAVEQQPTSPVAPPQQYQQQAAPPQPAAPVPAPAPVPGATSGDPKWDRFFQDWDSGRIQSDWYDNRQNKRGNGPDFKHKSEDIALWLAPGKYPHKPGVLAGLQQRGLSF